MKILLIISIIINVVSFILWRKECNDNYRNKEALRRWRMKTL